MANFEKQLLQIVVAVGSLVPIGAGAAGMLYGPAMMGDQSVAPIDLDSHFRYLSGLLLAIGLGYASTVPRIEAKSRRFYLLTAIVFVGGFGRLLSMLSVGAPSQAMIGALIMELLVAPALAVWQMRLARHMLSMR